ncbi:MAG: tRNA (adenosine(37)-N6)-dimethylallyltransferase MiaA [Proteiniphilum sp.]|nr:tRNA (adenosine(37)-N6)-dimethylallyltransferase MiaA [Proteiniphilum sp.]
MKQLLVLLGPTGVGKTEWSIRMAEQLGVPIVSADSRQLYKGLIIGTAAPTEEQLKRVPHHLVGILSPNDYYSASEYENEALSVINKLHEQHDTVILTGGSMMYIDAICKGIDIMPDIDQELRNDISKMYNEEGLDPIRQKLKLLDPIYYDQVDLKNTQRVIHALEVCIMTGKPYSSFRLNTIKERPFEIIKVGFNRPRPELYDRINKRVDEMIKDGLEEEARQLYPMKHLNSLNTVGYKEMFEYFDGNWTLEEAIDKIKQHSRNYARKQLSWFNRDKSIKWIDLSDKYIDVVNEIQSLL